MKNHFVILRVFLAVLMLSTLYYCTKDSTKEVTPPAVKVSLATVTTTPASTITATGATLGGNVTSDGNATVIERGVVYAITQNPTTSNTKVANGTGTGSFTSNITGLTAGTTYYVRAYATNSQGTAYGSQETFNTTTSGGSSTITDIDNNVYQTVTIGTQVWMAENLKVTKYNDNSVISGYYWYGTNGPTLGALYTWSTVDKGKLCPIGWHVPSGDEWTVLVIYLGGDLVAGGKLKTTGISLWESPNTGATNSSGFSALPGGYRMENGQLFGLAQEGNWWTSTSIGSSYAAWSIVLTYNHNYVGSSDTSKEYALSVRCIKN